MQPAPNTLLAQRPANGPRGLAAGLVVIAVTLGLLCSLAWPTSAKAHPLGNFTINRYARIELYQGEVVVHYVLDFAEIPAFQLKEEFDSDGDGQLTGEELRALVSGLAQDTREGLDLAAGGAVSLAFNDGEATVGAGQGGLDVIRVALVFRGAVEDGGPADVTFIDRNFAGRAGWREVVVRPSAGSSVEAEEALPTDISDALRSYPSGGDSPVSAVSEAAFRWDPASGSPAPETIAPERGDADATRSDRFSRLLERNSSVGVVIMSLLAAVGFGALHALGPGHGKSVVAAYLVGSRGTVRHAFALGVTVTVTHTAAVYALGAVTLVASGLIAPDRLFLYLGICSGLLIAGMGTALFVSRARGLLRRHREPGTHRHGLFGRAHSHGAAHGHNHDMASDDAHDAHGHAPSAVSWRSLVTLGVAGGLIPCPSALVVMLAAISLGQVLFGMLLIVAFSAGLAGVLVAIGVALVLGRRLPGRSRARTAVQRAGLARALPAVPVLSAFAVTLAGIAITYQAWNQPGL